MSRFLRALPWALLALSLAAHAWRTHRHTGTAPPPAPPLLRPPSSPAFQAHGVMKAGDPDLGSSISPGATITPSTADASTVGKALSAYATLIAASQETAEQHDELARVLARWIATAPADAAEWLAAQTTAVGDDPRFDPALAQLSTHLVAQGRFDFARAWAEAIRNPEVRAWAFEEILAEQYRARQLDPAALHTAAAHAGIPAERVRAILDYSRLD